jgi:hypothetical protein
VIDRLLDAFGIQAAFIGIAQQTVRCGETGIKLRADGWNMRFDDGSPVLCEKTYGERGDE